MPVSYRPMWSRRTGAPQLSSLPGASIGQARVTPGSALLNSTCALQTSRTWSCGDYSPEVGQRRATPAIVLRSASARARALGGRTSQQATMSLWTFAVPNREMLLLC